MEGVEDSAQPAMGNMLPTPSLGNGELSQLLTPALFTDITNARLPYAKNASLDFVEIGRDIFLEDPFGPVVRDAAWPALIALSKVRLDDMPDPSTFLPAPTDPSYPKQCLGFQLLLDNIPRLLLSGIDHRWTFAYFSEVSQRLAETWHALPDDQRPDKWERWQQDGTGLDYWINARFWFGAPFVHSESLAHQKIALEFTDETRTVVEAVSGQTDPNRVKRAEILADLTGFPREYRKGPPQGADVTRENWTWWMTMLMDIHFPIINRFGRYPYVNAITGRDSTAEEVEWIEETTHYGEASKEVARRVRDDVENGRWTPLGRDSDVSGEDI